MKPIFILVAALGVPGSAQADLFIQQQLVSQGQSSTATLNVKGNRIRLDIAAGQSGGSSTITDLKTGDVIILLHSQKMFAKARVPAPAKGAVQAKAPVPRDTGKAEKLGSYNTEIYTWSNPRGITGTMWVASNYPDYAKIRPDLAMLDKSGGDLSPVLSQLPGMVVKSQIAGGGQTITATLISAKAAGVDASLFQIPAGYHELPRAKPVLQQAPRPAPGK